MKIATGAKLICPSCNGYLCRPVAHDEKYAKPGDAIRRFEHILEGEGVFTMFYAECACGLCMFCRWTLDGWEYRVML